jgi:hypothetical protein
MNLHFGRFGANGFFALLKSKTIQYDLLLQTRNNHDKSGRIWCWWTCWKTDY